METNTSYKANDNLLKATRKLVDELHDVLQRPWTFGEGSGVFERYRQPDGTTNISLLIRNASFAQRLYKMQDEIINAVVAIQILRDEATPADEASNISSNVLKNVEYENLSAPTIRAVTCLLNALGYFFDFPSKDSAYSTEEAVNFTYLRNSKLGVLVASLVQTEHFELNCRANDELEKGHFGLTTMETDDSGSFTIRASGSPGASDLITASEKILLDLHQTLQAILNIIKADYIETLGYSSSDDLIVKNEQPNGPWLRAEGVAAETPTLFKIFNLWEGDASVFETPAYRIKRNYLYEQSLARKHRSGNQKVKSIKIGTDKPAEITSSINRAQEGEYVWTHTLEFKRVFKRESTRERYIQDACLALALVSGYGVFSEDNTNASSHKAKGVIRYRQTEYRLAFDPAIKTIAKASKLEADFYRLILAKYRQAMQPSTIEGQLIRIWEILDNIADFYCEDEMKPLPEGFNDYKSLRKQIKTSLTELQSQINIPLVGDDALTPIFLNKSIGHKTRNVLKKFEVASIIGAEPSNLKKSVDGVYKLRSKLTHTAVLGSDKGTLKELVNTYFFVSELVFLLMTLIFNHPNNSSTVNELKDSLSRFVSNPSSYTDRSRQIQRKSKKFDQMLEVLAGKRPWPKGKTSFTI